MLAIVSSNGENLDKFCTSWLFGKLQAEAIIIEPGEATLWSQQVKIVLQKRGAFPPSYQHS